MARDGTNRGGRRVRAGDKPAGAAEKIQNGKMVKVLANDIPVLKTAELEAVDLPEGAVLEGADMPKPSDYLSARQKNGVPLGADAIYKETWLWLKERNCERLVNPRLIETYSQAMARYIQCEDATSTYGLLGKHPTTGGVMTSPFVQMSNNIRKAPILSGMKFTTLLSKTAQRFLRIARQIPWSCFCGQGENDDGAYGFFT